MIQIGSRVQVIDKSSPYYGKTGIVIDFSNLLHAVGWYVELEGEHTVFLADTALRVL